MRSDFGTNVGRNFWAPVTSSHERHGQQRIIVA